MVITTNLKTEESFKNISDGLTTFWTV